MGGLKFLQQCHLPLITFAIVIGREVDMSISRELQYSFLYISFRTGAVFNSGIVSDELESFGSCILHLVPSSQRKQPSACSLFLTRILYSLVCFPLNAMQERSYSAQELYEANTGDLQVFVFVRTDLLF